MFYSLREGIAGLRRARFAALASISAMTVALVLIGLFLLLGFQAHQVTNWLKQRVGELEIFFEESTSDAYVQRVQRQIQTWPEVETAVFISREEAEAIFRREFGEEAEIFLDEHFLPPSVRVRLKPEYVQSDSMEALASRLKQLEGVEEVVFNQPLLVKVQRNLELVTLIGFIVITLVIIAALFLVANTVRLTIYARRQVIRTMKLVGATPRFIRRPFKIEGALQGLIAGLLASVILWSLAGVIEEYMPAVRGHLWPGGVPWYLLGAIVVLGVIMGWVSSAIAVRRFIRTVAIQ